MKPAKHSVAAEKLGRSDPIYTAVVQAVWYHTLPTATIIDRLKDVIAQHGQPAVEAAASELLDYQQHDGVPYARLKPELYLRCRMLNGPMPSEWETWWQNADGRDRKGKPKVWPPKVEGPPAPSAAKPVDSAKPAAVTPPSLATDALDAQTVTTLTERMLGDRLHMARQRYGAYSPNSDVGRQASREIDLLSDEYKRRGLTIPVSATAGRGFGSMSLADLTATYRERQFRARTHRGKPAGRQAKDDVARIEGEFQARGIPLPEPATPERKWRGQGGRAR
jgi:hypothetical protein